MNPDNTQKPKPHSEATLKKSQSRNTIKMLAVDFPEKTDVRSIISDRRKKKGNNNLHPTDIFAQNLSDAVMDADDSDDLESFVYRDKYNEMYYYSSTESINADDKHSKRPILRPTVSEIRPSTSSYRPGLRYKTMSDEEFTPLMRYRHRKKVTQIHKKSNSPLSDVEVVGISNVLGTQKELIFNLHVKASNSNWWTIRMTNTAFSVFASSHYVPTSMISSVNNMTTRGADPAEFLGTIYHLEDPLIYQSGGLFQSVVSTATSQIQIKNPGATKDDMSGNERWSLLIRYPYELTVRGVLKYQILPYLSTQLHSVRVCKMSRIDPATGKISLDIPIPEKSICDDPSPVEGNSS